MNGELSAMAADATTAVVATINAAAFIGVPEVEVRP
jgi:hypothetical protein